MGNADLNSLLDQLAPVRARSSRFLLALLWVGVAAAFAAAAQLLFGSAATLVLAAAVIAATGLFGLIAGQVSAALALSALDFFFVPPLFRFKENGFILTAAVEFAGLALATHFISARLSKQIRSKKARKLGVHGQLDGIVNGEVYGWAMNADDPTSPVVVTVYVDAQPVGEVAAAYYRPDLETRLQASGSHAFYIDLSTRIASGKEAVVEAIATTQALKNSPRTMRIPARRPSPGPAVVFMHIPKTAGIAFREAIAANYRVSEVAYLYGTPPGLLGYDLRLLPLSQRRDLRFVMGHFPYGIHHFLPQETLYITIVRNPAARLLSQYAFLQHTQPDLLRERGRLLTLEELLVAKPHIHFDNALVRHFGDVNELAFPAGTINEDLYCKAVENLRNGFAFVGHQEYAAEAYAWLKQRFGWHAKPNLDFVNAGPIPVDTAEKTAVREAVQRFNHWDHLLYQDILQLFPFPSSS